AVLPRDSTALQIVSRTAWAAPCSISGATRMRILKGDERSGVERRRVAVDDFVHLAPARERLHRREPARDAWIFRVAAAHGVAERDERRAEIIGDRELVAAQIAILRAEQVPVAHAEHAGRPPRA